MARALGNQDLAAARSAAASAANKSASDVSNLTSSLRSWTKDATCADVNASGYDPVASTVIALQSKVNAFPTGELSPSGVCP